MAADTYSEDRDQPLFVALRANDPELARCRDTAQRTLPLFLNLFDEYRSNLGVYFAFKVPIKDGDDVAHLWYSLASHAGDTICGEHFELPPELADRKSIEVRSDEIEDWMVNDHGVLYGGFSIRYQRSLTPESQRESFDRYTGVTKYAEIG